MAKPLKQRKKTTASEAGQYSEEMIQTCIQYIDRGEKTVYAACKMFNIPMSTVRYRMSGQWKKKRSTGPRSVLTIEEEQQIVDWLIGMQERGFPVSRRTMIFKVSDFLTENPRETPFKHNRPGKYYCIFLTGTQMKNDLLFPGRKWFASFMRRNPGFSLRTPEAITSASARVSEEDLRGWFGSTRTFLAKNHLLHIMNFPNRVWNGDETSFYLHPKSKEVIARTGSRNVYEVEQAPGKHITQPADVAVFKPLKDEWKKVVEEWRSGHCGEIFTLAHFGPVLVETVKRGIKSDSIVNGFRKCGLFPFNPDNVDYSKFLARKRKPSDDHATVNSSVVESCNPIEVANSSVHDASDPVVMPSIPPVPEVVRPESPQLAQCSSPFVSVRTEEECVSIHIDKTIQAVDMIGTRTMERIQGDVSSLSREERIIRFFFREFVQPYVTMSTNEAQANCQDADRDPGESTMLSLNQESRTANDSTVVSSITDTCDRNETEMVEVENEGQYQDNPIIIELTDYTHGQTLAEPKNSNNVLYCQLNDGNSTIDELPIVDIFGNMITCAFKYA